MHYFDENTDALAERVLEYAKARTRLDPIPLNFPKTEAELRSLVGETITEAVVNQLIDLDPALAERSREDIPRTCTTNRILAAVGTLT